MSRSAQLERGQRVRVAIARGQAQEGTVQATYRERGCGCHSVVVRLDSGREWAGKLSEVEVLP